MRRLILFPAFLSILLSASCQRHDRVVVQATEENEEPELASVIHVADPRVAHQLLRGFYDVEQNSWRWTMGKFTVVLRPPAGASVKGADLQAKLSVPEAVIARLQSLRLDAKIGEFALEGETFLKAGEHTYRRAVPASVLGSDAVTVDFVLDKFLPPGNLDQRELGLVVSTIGFEAK
jgi:hypothetical protein